MTAIRFFPAAVFTVLSFFAEAATLAQFDHMTARVPNTANTIVLINVEKLLNSPMAVAENWREDPVKRFAAGLTNVPSDSKQVLIASQLDIEFMRPVWELGMVQVDQVPTTAELAAKFQGTADSVADLPAVRLPDDSYLVRFSDTLLGAHAPGNRQAVSRWLYESEGSLSPYLQEAIGYAARGTEFIVAVDLKDSVAIDGAQKQLEAFDSQVLKDANLDPRELAELLASVKGLMLGMTFDRQAFGKIKLDFGRDASMLADIAKPLFLSILEQRGLMIDEFHEWKAKVEGDRIIFGGYLTSSGLMRLSSLIDLPTQALYSLPRRPAGRGPSQTEEPSPKEPPQVADQPPATDSKTAVRQPAETAIPNTGQAIIEPTRQYFQKVDILLRDLRSRKREARTFGQIGLWYENYARKIDRLPLMNVDDQMLDYGGYVGYQLRNASHAIRTGSAQSRLGQISAVNQGVPDPRLGPDGRRGMTLREEAAARTQVRTFARVTSASSAQQIELEIDAATSEVRRLIAKKYQVDL